MDVLSVLKSEHDRIKGLLSAQGSDINKTELRRISSELKKEIAVNLKLEEEYLYPEVNGLFSGSNVVVDNFLTTHQSIKDTLHHLADSVSLEKFTKLLHDLRDQLTKLYESEERLLMPKIRQLIPTQAREDLGQVWLEYKEEALAEAEAHEKGDLLDLARSITPVSPSKRKRRA